MMLSNGNPTTAQIQAMTAKRTTDKNKIQFIPTSLSSPMVTRIHNMKPGCGSCGRH